MDELDSRTGIYTVRNGVRQEIRIEHPDFRMLDIYASWTPQRRLKASADMMRAARRIMTAGVRQQHPDWSDQDVRREVARRYLGYRD
jgi:2-methylaconitate cis-trans-isomerase PrpF